MHRMPVGVEQWRAGIGRYNCDLSSKAVINIHIPDLIASVCYTFAYLCFLIWISVITLPFSILASSFFSLFAPCEFLPFKNCSKNVSLQDPCHLYIKTTLFVLVTICFMFTWLGEILTTKISLLRCSPAYRRYVVVRLQYVLHFVLFINLLDFLNIMKHYPLDILLLLGGDIETNPGPQTEKSLKFFHWNLNSICARGAVKIPLIEAYDSVHKFDLIAISETMLNSTIGNDVISIDRLSREIYRADHPSDNKIGGVCLYFREGLPIKRRKDLELLQEMSVAEITISRKKILFSTIYRSPSQNSEQFEHFIDRLHRSLNVMQRERPLLIILTGDLNCRSS